MVQAEMYLSSQDKCWDAAAYLITQFLTRPDSLNLLNDFMASSLKLIQKDLDDVSWHLVALLTALTSLFQYGKREDLIVFAQQFLGIVETLCTHSGTKIRKMSVKLAQRIGLVFLQPRVAKWRYIRNVHKWNSSKENNDPQEYDVREEIQDIIVILLQSLRDVHRIVRWSAAKGFGRICERLPLEFVDDVITEIFGLFKPSETHQTWHGGCLAMAEISRRGLMMPERLSAGVDHIAKALVFDIRMGTYSFGDEIRNAACYVVWSFARIYHVNVLGPFIRRLLGLLSVVFLFDRQVVVRRAAAAAFQEMIGREAASSPVDIDILTTCDYFAVGGRINCFTHLCFFVGQHSYYRQYMIEHLFSLKISHWDPSIRKLAVGSLKLLVVYDPTVIIEGLNKVVVQQSACISSNISIRHGAILTLAEITEAFHNHLSIIKCQNDFCQLFGQDLYDAARNLIPNLCTLKLLYSSYEWHTDSAVCVFISRYAGLKLFQVDMLDYALSFLQQSLQHENERIRKLSTDALGIIYTNYYNDWDYLRSRMDVHAQIIQGYIDNVMNHTSSVLRMAGILSVRSLSAVLIAYLFSSIVDALKHATLITTDTINWAECRAEALVTIKLILLSDMSGVDERMFNDIISCVQTCFEDYTQNEQGNIGNITRVAAIETLGEIIISFINNKHPFITTQVLYDTIRILCWQSCEQHHTVMIVAVQNISKILQLSRECGNDFWAEIVQLVPLGENYAIFANSENLKDLEKISEIFNFVLKFMRIPNFRKLILFGAIQSLADRTRLNAKVARESFMAYLEKYREDVEPILKELINIGNEYSHNDRIILPLYWTCEYLFNNDVLEYVENRQPISVQFVSFLNEGVSGCRCYKKLALIAKILCCFVMFEETRVLALTTLLVLLGHRFSSVRCETAESLYEALLVCDDMSEQDNDVVTELLSVTRWRENKEYARNIRNEISDLLCIKRPHKLN